MSWFTDLAGRAEQFLNKFDEEAGKVLTQQTQVSSERSTKVVSKDKDISNRTSSNSTSLPPFRLNSAPISRVSESSPVERKLEKVKPLVSKLTPSANKKKDTPTDEQALLDFLNEGTRKSPTPPAHLNKFPETLLTIGNQEKKEGQFLSDDDGKRVSPGIDAKEETVPTEKRDPGVKEVTSFVEREPEDVDADEVARLEAELAQVDSLRKELRVAQQEVKHLRVAQQKAVTDAKKRDGELRRLTKQLAESSDVVDKLREDKEVLERQIRAFEGEMEEKEGKIKGLEAALRMEKQAAQASQTATKEQMADLEKRLSSMRDGMDVENVSRSQELAEMQREVERREAQVKELRGELEEYKAKAQRILASKEKLIVSLKSSRGEEEEEGSPELQEAREEVSLLKEELATLQGRLFTCQRHVTDLEREVAEGGNREQALKERLRREEARNREVVEERARMAQELSMYQKEMSTQKSNWMESIAEKESEIGRLSFQLSALTRATSPYGNRGSSPSPPPLKSSDCEQLERKIQALTQSLLHKQTLVENLSSQCNSLQLQLERSEECQRRSNKGGQTAISLTDDAKAEYPTWQASFPSYVRGGQGGSSYEAWINKGHDGINHMSNLMVYYLRRYPVARFAFFFYALLLHLWVFFVLLTYQPEIHPPGYHPPDGDSGLPKQPGSGKR
ncbi:unnamed protein product [Cyprideis torosa]|uniref:Uncharacterized protein n=1 Tax=Cyprideis torosa TaxID=163714 RepID=A0A7R8WG59_9CRUS|nr:unnamed protein product [Cyprideis torosa]CAG0896193.1 unnamed protein product [Cyprideis torosa]